MKYLTTDEFKTQVLDYTQTPHKFLNQKPTILKFTAPWCGPCKMLDPVLKQIEKEYEGNLDILNINVDEEHEPAAAFGVKSVPNMIFIPTDDKQPERMVGALPKKAIKDAIKNMFNL